MAPLNSIALDSVPSTGSKNKTYTTDARLVFVKTKTYTTDAILRATFTKTYTTDAILQGGATKFYSTDAILVTPYHDFGQWHEMIGNNLSVPIDPNRISTWSTYSRPSSPLDGQTGRNVQTGKVETWDEKSGTWKLADGTAA